MTQKSSEVPIGFEALSSTFAPYIINWLKVRTNERERRKHLEPIVKEIKTFKNLDNVPTLLRLLVRILKQQPDILNRDLVAEEFLCDLIVLNLTPQTPDGTENKSIGSVQEVIRSVTVAFTAP